jgi:hypothetical protein
MPSGLAFAGIIAGSIAVASAQAETRTFILASNSDGYGVDHCLAAREPCGAAVANSYCRSRAYIQAVSFRKVLRRDLANASSEGLACRGGICGDFIAIECIR